MPPKHAPWSEIRQPCWQPTPSGSRPVDEVEQVFLGRRLLNHSVDANLGGAKNNAGEGKPVTRRIGMPAPPASIRSGNAPQADELLGHHRPANPRKGTATPSRMPRRRKPAIGMRQDGPGKPQTVNQNHPSVTGEPPVMGGSGTMG